MPSLKNLYSNKSSDSNFKSLIFNHSDNEYKIFINLEIKGKDKFVGSAFYTGNDEDSLLNSYLNLLLGRGLDVLDRTTIKELDYFLREDRSKPHFDKIGPEELNIISLGGKLKELFVNKKITEIIYYDPKLHGDVEFMSYGEVLEVLEDSFSDPQLVNYKIEILELEQDPLKLTIRTNGSFDDISNIINKLTFNELEIINGN